MNAPEMISSGPADYELRFLSLHDAGRAYAFPCDAAGHVDMDALSDTARDNYLFARTVVGREFSIPAVTSRWIRDAVLTTDKASRASSRGFQPGAAVMLCTTGAQVLL